MKSIRFSNLYTKMPPNPHPSVLLEVFVVGDDLHPNFVNYDTKIVGGGHYKLPSGKKLVLLLRTSENLLWTTIRKYSESKEAYYRRLRGHVFGIDVSETDHSLNEFTNRKT